jgi:tetratricopeptide (TPR) repeat protein
LRITHYIAIASAVGLIALLYWGGKTTPPHGSLPVADMQRPPAGAATQAPNIMKAASFDSILTASRRQLSKTIADSVKTIETELSAIHDSSRMAVVFYKLSGVWQRANVLQVAAFYSAKAAKLENSEKNLTFAGQFYLQLMENENVPSVQMWDAEEAVGCLEQSQKINPDNEETKLALATAYMEGTGEPMRGVQILLAIVKEKPGDIPANLLLGKMSVQSRQFDKAVGRFETVLKQEPENKEALYFLAQAYQGMGDKKKAIELLEKCKKLVNDPAFSNDVDQQINSLK